MTTSPASVFTIAVATHADRPVLERLWALFRHDMSEHSGALPDATGRFRQERLDAAFDTPGWLAYGLHLGGSPVGLAIVRGVDADERVLSSFFLVRGARRAGLGLVAARHIIAQHPGAWAVAFQDANTGAARFWRRVATDAAGAAWTQTHAQVPDRPDLAPDTWIRFDTCGPAARGA